MNELEHLLAAELAQVAGAAPRWGDPATRIRRAARRRQQRQVAVLAAAGVVTGVSGVAALPWADPAPSLTAGDGGPATPSPSPSVPASESPTPSPSPSPSPTATTAAPATKAPPAPPPPPSATPSLPPSPPPSPAPSSAIPVPYGPGMEIGREYRYDLYTHCGIEFATFDGRDWRTGRLDDGSNNPPPGWGNPSQPGAVVLLRRDLAEFRGDNGKTLTFEPTDVEPGMCM